MALIDAFLTEPILVEDYLREGSGRSLFGPAEERRGRVEPAWQEKIVYKNPSGLLEEVDAGMLVFTTGPAVPINSRVTVGGRCLRCIKCTEMSGFSRSHLELVLA